VLCLAQLTVSKALSPMTQAPGSPIDDSEAPKSACITPAKGEEEFEDKAEDEVQDEAEEAGEKEHVDAPASDSADTAKPKPKPKPRAKKAKGEPKAKKIAESKVKKTTVKKVCIINCVCCSLCAQLTQLHISLTDDLPYCAGQS